MNISISQILKPPSILKKRAASNIFSIIILRGGNIGLQLLIIPISINFVSASSYGLWLTLSSMISWLNIMDIGISNGLRNKLTEAITQEKHLLGKVYVSTTYGLLFVFSFIGFIICLGLIFLLSWDSLIDVPKDLSQENFKYLLIIISSSFFITFLLKPISSVAYATHNAYVQYLILFLANLINVGLIWYVTQIYSTGSLIALAFCFCFTPIIVTLFLSIYLFQTKFRKYLPSIKYINFSYAKDLMSLSGKFFIIQIAATVVFTTNNFIISHFFGNEEVTTFNVVQRYFNVFVIFQSMILVPFWAIFTEAYSRRDRPLLIGTMKKLQLLAFIMSVGCIGLVIIADYVYPIWIGNAIHVPLRLNITMCLYTILILFSAVYGIFINGTGKVQLQMFISMVTSTLHIPLAIISIKYFGAKLPELILVSCFWLIITMPIKHIQYRKILSFQAINSIWSK